MKKLFEMDIADYDINSKPYYRPSARGVILKEGKIALVYSKKEQYYKFPGGGIKDNEDKIEALIREVSEEVGLRVITKSIKEFGFVLRKQKGKDNTIFIQENYYYFCDVEETRIDQSLDEYEKELGFVLKYVSIDDAIEVNHKFKSDNFFDSIMIKREERVLRLLKEYLNI